MKWVFGRSGLLLIVCAMGCGRYVAKYVESGDSYFKQQKYQEAVSEYLKAARFDANDEHIVRQLGLSYYNLKKFQDAFQYLSKAELSKPSDREVKLTLGQLYLIDHKPDQALRRAQAVLASEPANASALELLASAYLNQKDFTKAIETYRRLVELFPSAADRHSDLGVALIAGQRIGEARKEFETALSLAPDNVQAGTQIANLDLLAGRTDDALAHIQKQIAAAGKKPKLLLVLASVQASRGDALAAERTYREAVRLDPNHSEARLALADFYVRTGKVDQATPVLDSAIAVEKTAPGYQLQGIILQMRGNTIAARHAYQQALALNPTYPQAANNLAWLLAEKLGDIRGGYNVALTAYQASPDDPHIQDTFGWILYRIGDEKRAVNMLKSSAERLPGSPGVQYHLGMALLSQGDTAEARRALTKALSSPLTFDDRSAAQKRLQTLR
jgi:Flp pilus assembly protein TadD